MMNWVDITTLGQPQSSLSVIDIVVNQPNGGVNHVGTPGVRTMINKSNREIKTPENLSVFFGVKSDAQTTVQGKKKEEISIEVVPEKIKFYPVYTTTQGLSLFEMIMTRHPPTWSEFFLSTKNEVAHACQKIEELSSRSGKVIYPRVEHILSAFWLTPLPFLKCVILGQDPYPGVTKQGVPKAIGICFGSERDSGEIPDSLIAIYKELEDTVEDWKHPGHPDIRSWGFQGVLMINAALTVEAGSPGSHSGIWKAFTEKLMDYLNEKCSKVVFMLWGKAAQSAASDISGSKHLKLTAYHPSPKNRGTAYDYYGNDHFNQANIYLVKNDIHPIDWRLK